MIKEKRILSQLQLLLNGKNARIRDLTGEITELKRKLNHSILVVSRLDKKLIELDKNDKKS